MTTARSAVSSEPPGQPSTVTAAWALPDSASAAAAIARTDNFLLIEYSISTFPSEAEEFLRGGAGSAEPAVRAASSTAAQNHAVAHPVGERRRIEAMGMLGPLPARAKATTVPALSGGPPGTGWQDTIKPFLSSSMRMRTPFAQQTTATRNTRI